MHDRADLMLGEHARRPARGRRRRRPPAACRRPPGGTRSTRLSSTTHALAARAQLQHDVAADVAGAAGDQNRIPAHSVSRLPRSEPVGSCNDSDYVPYHCDAACRIRLVTPAAATPFRGSARTRCSISPDAAGLEPDGHAVRPEQLREPRLPRRARRRQRGRAQVLSSPGAGATRRSWRSTRSPPSWPRAEMPGGRAAAPRGPHAAPSPRLSPRGLSAAARERAGAGPARGPGNCWAARSGGSTPSARLRPFAHRPRLAGERLGARCARSPCWHPGSCPAHVRERYAHVSAELVAAITRRRCGGWRPGAIRLHGDCHLGNILWHTARPGVRRPGRLPAGAGDPGPVDVPRRQCR